MGCVQETSWPTTTCRTALVEAYVAPAGSDFQHKSPGQETQRH